MTALPPPPTGPAGPVVPPAPTVATSRAAGRTPVGRPPAWAAFRAIYGLLLRSVATKGRLVAVGALAGISVITGLAAHSAIGYSSIDTGVGFVSGNLVTLIPVAVLVFGSAALGDLIDDSSLVYLWLRPVPSWIPVLAAWCVTATLTVPLVLAPTLLAAMVIDPEGVLAAGTILAGLIAIASYGGLFVLLGVRFRRALPWGLAYLLIWEGFVANAGKAAAKLALRSYVASVLSEVADWPIKLGRYALWVGIVVPLVVTVLALAAASRRLARADVA